MNKVTEEYKLCSLLATNLAGYRLRRSNEKSVAKKRHITLRLSDLNNAKPSFIKIYKKQDCSSTAASSFLAIMALHTVLPKRGSKQSNENRLIN